MAVSSAGFKTRFPRYASVADATVDLYLDLAGRRFNSDDFEDDDLKDDAHYYLAAHIYTVEQSGVEGTAGPVTSKRVGDVAITYGGGGTSNNSLLSTVYGQQFVTIMRTQSLSPIVV
jgi:hypothetical protein